MIYLLIIQTVIAKEISELKTLSLFNSIQKKDIIDVVLYEQMNIRQYPEAQYVIDAEIISEDKQNICYLQQGKVVFGDYEDYSEKIISSTNYSSNDPESFLNIPVLLNMVHIAHGFAMVTSNHQLLIYSIENNNESVTRRSLQLQYNKSFQFLRLNANEFETPQIVYAEYTQYLYIIYKDQVIGGKINYNNYNEFQLRNITINGFEKNYSYIGKIKIFEWQIFVPLGSFGIDIFSYHENGDIELIGKLNSSHIYDFNKSINIVDVIFGGDQDTTYLYILDNINGIVRFNLNSTQTNIELTIDQELGRIPIMFGITFQEFNNQYILILCEKNINNYLVEIALMGNQWFQVKTHNLNGRYFEIKILPQFTLLRGKDEHRIIRTGIYTKFETQYTFTQMDNLVKEKKNIFYEDYVFVPNLLTMDFYNVDVGNLSTLNNFNYNITNSFLIGITYQSIVYMPYFINNPYVRCRPYSFAQIGQVIKYTANINSTHCPEKENIQNIPQQLILCQYQDNFTIMVVTGDEAYYDTELLASIIIGIIILLILLLILLTFLYSKYKIKKDALNSEIQGFSDETNNRNYNLESHISEQDVQGL